jgi:hypothetical protein
MLLLEDPIHRESVRKEWESAIRGNMSLRSNSTPKNPEKLQITNIEFKEDMEDSVGSSHSRQILNRDRRKEMRVLKYSSVLRPEKRPSTTSGYNREQRPDDNII